MELLKFLLYIFCLIILIEIYYWRINKVYNTEGFKSPENSSPNINPPIDMSKYILKTKIPITKNFGDMSKYILKTEIPSSKEEIDISKYILKTEIPSSKEEIDISKYILKTEIPSSKEEIDMSKYILKTEIPYNKEIDISKYILKTQVPSVKNPIDMTKFILKTNIPTVDLSKYTRKKQPPSSIQNKNVSKLRRDKLYKTNKINTTDNKVQIDMKKHKLKVIETKPNNLNTKIQKVIETKPNNLNTKIQKVIETKPNNLNTKIQKVSEHCKIDKKVETSPTQNDWYTNQRNTTHTKIYKSHSKCPIKNRQYKIQTATNQQIPINRKEIERSSINKFLKTDTDIVNVNETNINKNRDIISSCNREINNNKYTISKNGHYGVYNPY